MANTHASLRLLHGPVHGGHCSCATWACQLALLPTSSRLRCAEKVGSESVQSEHSMELSWPLCFHDRRSPWVALLMILIVLSDFNLSKFHKWILRIIVWPSNLTSPQPQKNLCIIKIYKDSSKKKGALEKGPCRTSREIKNLLSSTYSTIHLFQAIQGNVSELLQ